MPINKFALFCPVNKACEILEPKWTLLILTEMWWGSSRFNDIRRGVPGISPTLLTKRLKELEAHGMIERVENPQNGSVEYLRTQMAVELEPIIQSLGNWAYKNTTSEDALCHMDSSYLMWNIRRCILPEELPPRRIVMQFIFNEPDKEPQNYWTISKPGAAVDVCYIEPGFDVDLFVISELRGMVSAYMGHTELQSEINAGTIQLIGNPVLEKTVTNWFILSSYARGPNAHFRRQLA
ncbi:MAG: helix-turn-helix domain-containing protein [Pseudomonadota bacterium]